MHKRAQLLDGLTLREAFHTHVPRSEFSLVTRPSSIVASELCKAGWGLLRWTDFTYMLGKGHVHVPELHPDPGTAFTQKPTHKLPSVSIRKDGYAKLSSVLRQHYLAYCNLALRTTNATPTPTPTLTLTESRSSGSNNSSSGSGSNRSSSSSSGTSDNSGTSSGGGSGSSNGSANAS